MKRILTFIICTVLSLCLFAAVSIRCLSETVHHIYQQADPAWGSYPYGSGNPNGNDLKNNGCGVFATINAVEYLTGSFIDPKTFADWAMDSELYVSGAGSFWTIAKNSVEEFGASCGYALDAYYEFSAHVRVNSSGYPTTPSGMRTIWKVLTSKLKKGDTCVSLVQGHFIAIVDYDINSDKVLVYDSAAIEHRGTDASADSSINWKTMNELWYGSREGKERLKLAGMMTFFKRSGPPSADIGDGTYEGSTEAMILGDADGDGIAAIYDATAIQRTLASLPTQSYSAEAADTDRDGKVTIIDATAIQRWLALLPTVAQGIGETIE